MFKGSKQVEWVVFTPAGQVFIMSTRTGEKVMCASRAEAHAEAARRNGK